MSKSKTKFLDLTGLGKYDALLKAWVKKLAEGLKSVSIEVVAALPAVAEAKENVIYFVKHEHTNATNLPETAKEVYDEYILVTVDGTKQFERIGSTDIDLSNETILDDKLAAAMTSALYKVALDKKGRVTSATAAAEADILSLMTNTYAKDSGLYKVTVDNYGRVTAATAVTAGDITSLAGWDDDTTYDAIAESGINALFVEE